MAPVRYELGFYIPEDNILHIHRRDHLKSYIDIVVKLLRLFNKYFVFLIPVHLEM
jgi:hypothetical protein